MGSLASQVENRVQVPKSDALDQGQNPPNSTITFANLGACAVEVILPMTPNPFKQVPFLI